MALPTTGVVSTFIGSKIGFVEWHVARGGWVSYANNFPTSWSGSDLIIGSSTSVLINRGVIEEIGVATPIGKGKEKKAKKDASKKSKAEEGVKGTEAGQNTKKRKTVLAQKQLIVLKELGEMDYSATRKEVSPPPIP